MADLLSFVLWPFTLIGLFQAVLWYRFKRQPGVDTSNWFNVFRFWWFANTRPDLFVGVFPWLGHDEKENIDGGEGPGVAGIRKSPAEAGNVRSES